jgi:general secretion pathway protein L
MTWWRTIGEILAHWTDTVATGVIALAGRFFSPRLVRLVEDDKPDSFALEGAGKAVGDPQRVSFANGQFSGADLSGAAKGSRIELVLRPSRFLVRPLELPARANEFIEAVFGCGTPVTAGSGKIVTTIAATTRANTEPYIKGLAALHPASLSIFTRAGDETRELIKVFEQQARGLLDRPRLSRLLRLVLAGVTAAAVLSTAGGAVMQNYLDGRQAELTAELTARRVALRLDRQGADNSPFAVLARRKHETQASVIVIEELSRILPDHTYVTELHIDGNTLQIAGITHDAPLLIRLIEQSPHFTRATFFAPTTRAPSDPGDRFHIEARLEPVNTVSQ